MNNAGPSDDARRHQPQACAAQRAVPLAPEPFLRLPAIGERVRREVATFPCGRRQACANSPGTVASPDSDDSTFRDRLADARSPEEAANILGKRRLIGYAVGFAAVAIGCLAATAYMIIEVAMCQESP